MKSDSQVQRTYTRKEISEWIRRYRASGLGLGTFAEQHGLPRTRLHYWVYDRRHGRLGKAGLVPAGFQELKLPTGLALPNWALEVSLPAGSVARFSAAAAPAWIGSVVEALRKPC